HEQSSNVDCRRTTVDSQGTHGPRLKCEAPRFLGERPPHGSQAPQLKCGASWIRGASLTAGVRRLVARERRSVLEVRAAIVSTGRSLLWDSGATLQAPRVAYKISRLIAAAGRFVARE